jgi:nitrogen fixation protein NifU and related proteins
MSVDVEAFIQELALRIDREEREAYGKEGSPWVTRMTCLEDPDGYARIQGRCGETMEVFLRFHDGQVTDASFRTDGCGSSKLCGSCAVEMAIGKSPDELLEITGEAILASAKGLTSEENHCAFLAAETLQEALNYFMLNRNRK